MTAGPTGPFALPEPPRTFERLVQIMRHNERLDVELRSLTARLHHTRSYLTEPGCSLVLGKANLGRLKAKYAPKLTLMRANRIEARHLMGCANRPSPVANAIAVTS